MDSLLDVPPATTWMGWRGGQPPGCANSRLQAALTPDIIVFIVLITEIGTLSHLPAPEEGVWVEGGEDE